MVLARAWRRWAPRGRGVEQRLSTGWVAVDLEAQHLPRGVWQPLSVKADVSVTWGPSPFGSVSLVRPLAGKVGSRPFVPADAIVSVGRRPGPGTRSDQYRAIGKRPVLVPTPQPVATANDNAGAPIRETRRARGVVRDLFFLALLGASLFGAWQSGRMSNVQNVIVVPDAATPGSRIT